MECPECHKGRIRVLEDTLSHEGHRFLICDNSECGTIFSVESGEPLGSSKLPPEFPMSKNETAMQAAYGICAATGISRELLAASLLYRAPLLEDFKASLDLPE